MNDKKIKEYTVCGERRIRALDELFPGFNIIDTAFGVTHKLSFPAECILKDEIEKEGLMHWCEPVYERNYLEIVAEQLLESCKTPEAAKNMFKEDSMFQRCVLATANNENIVETLMMVCEAMGQLSGLVGVVIDNSPVDINVPAVHQIDINFVIREARNLVKPAIDKKETEEFNLLLSKAWFDSSAELIKKVYMSKIKELNG